MKIAIVTFYRVANYGAMLQAYALERYLESLGHQVVFVSHPRTRERRLPFLRCLVSRRLTGVHIKLKNYVRFPLTDFAANYPQTSPCKTLDDVARATADCDAFVVGSDQMWNPLWCAGESLPLVMLDFAPVGKPRIAYAASFGTADWPVDANAPLAGELLRKFSKISVREESGVELVRKLSGRTDAVCLLDPTLLHDAAFYRELMFGHDGAAAHPSCIFRYVLDDWDDAASTQRAFDIVQGTLGIPRVETDRIPVSGTLGPLCRMLGVTAKIPVPEWLSKIAHADFVFTNSFHGTVFAILFHKPFISLFLRGRMSGMNERLLSLLSKLGLSERAVYSDEIEKIKAMACQPIQWEVVEESLRSLRHQSSAFFAHQKGASHGPAPV